MDNETEKILADQIDKLPREVLEFISTSPWNSDLDEIGSLYNLPTDELSAFKREVVFVLTGLVHPDAFMETLSQEVGIKGAVLEALVLNVEKKIFVPIRPALIKLFEDEASKEGPSELEVERPSEEGTTLPDGPMEGETFVLPTPAPSVVANPAPAKEWGKVPDVAPLNLPTDESAGSESAGFTPWAKTLGRELGYESFLPNLTPKIAEPTPTPKEEPSANPFEEKMRKVFTAGQQSMGDFTIEPAAPQPPTIPIRHTDPYREPIE